MSKYNYNIAIIAPLSELTRANLFMERNGYGPNNLKHVIKENGSIIGYGNMAPVDSVMLQVLQKGVGINPLIKYKVAGRDEDALQLLLDELGYTVG